MTIDVDIAVVLIVMRFIFHFRLCNLEGKFVAAKKDVIFANLVRDWCLFGSMLQNPSKVRFHFPLLVSWNISIWIN